MGWENSFDLPERQREKERKSKRSHVPKLSVVSRGCHPVRLHYKCDETSFAFQKTWY
ncbi:hypothetical protein DPMN_010531 [Dreissena polymorpha]|uniref:Uncharacterized protein n=1 Tax=Dreissena polymorpha TaxID=45954 RepID=A0A9D4N030_DREPO|nr:hypothetical protein DPMN_010531 [Dreissena polymorpha]